MKVETKVKENNPRNSAQLVVEAHNLSVKRKVEQFQSNGDTCEATPCSIVITEPEVEKVDDDTDKSTNRLSILSNSSAESSRSDHNVEEEAVNIEHGSSVFYVVWD